MAMHAPRALLAGLLLALAAGCGGVSGGAVAEVDGTEIERTTFDRWAKMVAARPGKTAGKPSREVRDQVLQLLISFQWLQGEAEEQDIKVSEEEVKKSFDQQKKQSFPKDADYQKFLKDSGQSEEDIMLQVKADLLASKIRDKVVKGKDKVSDAQIEDFYNKNKARFAQPERRDLLVVLTKGKAKAQAAKKALNSGQSWKSVAKKYSIDEASKAQ